MKRITITLLSLAILAVACGSDSTISVAAQDPDEPTATPTEPAQEDPAVAPPADDVILGAGPYPIGTINVVVTRADTGAQTAMYTLSCLGDTATLTGDWEPERDAGLLGGAADGMCLALGEPAVQSRLVDGLPDGLICTDIYGSADKAEVTGELNGQPVAASFARNNGCGISDWDDLMVGLLPPASAS